MTFNEWKESLVEGKNPCRKCRQENRDQAGDNFHYYGEGQGGTCFSCGYSILSDEYKEEYGINEIELEEYSWVATEFNEEIHNLLKENTGVDSKGYRGIRADISRSLGVRYEYSTEDGSVAKSYYPVTKECLEKDIKDSIVGYKVRSHPKTFLPPVGEADSSCDLFMQWKFKTHKGMLLITAGEVDAMSAYQMLYDVHVKGGSKAKGYDEIAVVSGITGEGGMATQLRGQYEWLTQFSKVIIAMDNDAAGKKATEQIASVLPKGKAFVMPLRYKDINEYLEKGKEQEFINDFWGNKAYAPVGIKGSSELISDIINSARTEKIPLPKFMHKLQGLMAGGIPLGVILNLGSASGQGKSTFVEELVYHWIFNSPYKVGVLSLESDSGEYGTKLLSRHLGRKINLIEDVDEKINYLESDYVQEKSKELFTSENGSNRFYLMDDRGGTVRDIQESVERMIKECQVRVVVLDPLQDVIASLPSDEQEKFMSWQKELVKSSGVTIININHVRKSSGGKEANSQGADISEEDFHGSSSIFKSGACNLLFTRNKESEDLVVRNTTVMKMTKCRWTGNTSPVAGKYYYDNTTHTLYDFEEWAKNNPHMIKEKINECH